MIILGIESHQMDNSKAPELEHCQKRPGSNLPVKCYLRMHQFLRLAKFRREWLFMLHSLTKAQRNYFKK